MRRSSATGTSIFMSALDLVTREVETHAGISANLGNTRVFNYEGRPPQPGIAELGNEIWRGNRPPQQCGFVALGTPIGTPEYVRAWGAERLETEDELLRQLPKLPDLQCAVQINTESSVVGMPSATVQAWMLWCTQTLP